MPLLLYTYIITETLAPFFASLGILTAILFLGKLIPLFNLIIDFGISFPDFIRLCSYLAPNLFLYNIPMASMLGVILCFTRLANDNEIIALKSAGIGLYRMLPPVLIVAVCTSLLASFFATTLIPRGTSSMRLLLVQLAKEKIEKGLQEKNFSEGIKDVVLFVDRINPNDNSWQGVYVADNRDPDNPLTIVARQGILNVESKNMELTLQLQSGSIHYAKNAVSQTLTFDKYGLRIPLSPPGSDSDNNVKSFNRAEMTQQELKAYINKHGNATRQTIDHTLEFYKRMTLPVGCFILTILGLPLAIRTRPGQRTIGVPLGLAIFICYYVLYTISTTLVTEGATLIALKLWAPNIIFGVLTLHVLRFANSERTNSVIDFVLKIISRLPLRRSKKEM